MRRTNCAGCGATNLEPFLDLGSTPLADRFPATPDEPEDRYPLEVAVCTACWLVQLLEVVPDEVLWADYGFYSGTSPGKVAYHRDYADWALRKFPEQARGLVVEVGCNDGDLLRHFAEAGAETLGVDPAQGPAMAAEERGLDVIQERFTLALAEDAGRQASLVIANHVAAHQADPHDFFAGIAALLADDGVALVEVQSLPDLLTGNQFDHVYHEHRFFYSVWSVAEIARRYDLKVRWIEPTEQQGGSVRVVFGKGDARWIDVGSPLWLRTMGTYQAFADRVWYVRHRLRKLLLRELAGKRLAGYGATAKSTTLLNWCGIGPDLLEYVEDTTPAKIGRYTPGTHIPIVAPGDREPPDVYLLLAWNYLPQVLRRERKFLDGGGRFLVPLPVPVIL